eukprot:UN22856
MHSLKLSVFSSSSICLRWLNRKTLVHVRSLLIMMLIKFILMVSMSVATSRIGSSALIGPKQKNIRSIVVQKLCLRLKQRMGTVIRMGVAVEALRCIAHLQTPIPYGMDSSQAPIGKRGAGSAPIIASGARIMAI